MKLKIASWNINSVRARENSLRKWISDENPDVIGLQETKVLDSQFPTDIFLENGFDVQFFGQKSYNGVSMAFRKNIGIECEKVVHNIPLWNDEQARVITCLLFIQDVLKVNFSSVYVPNGTAIGHAKFEYKLMFLEALFDFARNLMDENNCKVYCP